MAQLIREDNNDQATDLINEIPQIRLDVTTLPEAHQRQLYDAFHLQIRYAAHRHELIFRVTWTPTRRKRWQASYMKKFAMLRVPPAGHAERHKQVLTRRNASWSNRESTSDPGEDIERQPDRCP